MLPLLPLLPLLPMLLGVGLAPQGPSPLAPRLEQALGKLPDAHLDLLKAATDAASDDEIAWALGEADRRLRHPKDAFDAASIDGAVDHATRQSGERGAEQKTRVRAVLLQVMLGDITGAIRAYAQQNDKDMRSFNRTIVEKLDRIRQSREHVIQAFTRAKPPKAYAGGNPGQAARTQDRSAKYTQFVQMSAQLTGELQSTERELVDAMQTQFRNNETFWQTVAGFRDEAFRITDRVATVR